MSARVFDGLHAVGTSLCPWCGEPIFPGARIGPRYLRQGDGRGRFAGRHPVRDWYLHLDCAEQLDRKREAERRRTESATR